jgi:hypothetical protein
MLKLSTFAFWILYPPLIAFSITPLLAPEFSAAVMILRHGLVWLLALLALVYSNKVLQIYPIRRAVVLGIAATSIAALLWITKFTLSTGPNFNTLYSSFGFTAFLLAAATASYSLAHYGHMKVLLWAICISLVIFSFLHIAEGLEIFTDVYGRSRMVLGFVHPGKLSQLFAILAVIALVSRLNRHEVRFTSRNFWAFVFLFFLVALTSTRTTLITLFFLLLGRTLDRFSYTSKFTSTTIVVGLFFFIGVYAFLGLESSQANEFMSGRPTLWATTLLINLERFGSSMFLIGANGQPTAAYFFFLDGTQEQPSSFRVDNGFLEVLILHGTPVLILLTTSLLVLLRTDKKDSRAAILCMSILALQIGESGFYEIGGWFGFFLLALLFYSLRTIGYRPVRKKLDRNYEEG